MASPYIERILKARVCDVALYAKRTERFARYPIVRIESSLAVV